MPGSGDLCFLTDENVEKVFEAFREAKIEVCIQMLFVG